MAGDKTAAGEKKLVTLEAKDGRLEEPMEARLLLPSDLLKSMLPEDREWSDWE
jgi:hypothetical protein